MSAVDNRIAELEASMSETFSEVERRSAALAEARQARTEQRRELARLRSEKEQAARQVARDEWLAEEGYDYVSSNTDKYIVGVHVLPNEDRVLLNSIEWNQVTEEIVLDMDQAKGLLAVLQGFVR